MVPEQNICDISCLAPQSHDRAFGEKVLPSKVRRPVGQDEKSGLVDFLAKTTRRYSVVR